MAYDAKLLERIRQVSSDVDFVERKMFGSIAFMHNGHMTIGPIGSDLMVRVGPDAYEDCLKKKHVTEMTFTGRPMRGMVTVLAGGINTDKRLKKWVDQGLAFTKYLPAK